MSRPVGPNLKKLIIRKWSGDAVPPGGGFADAINAIIVPGAMLEGWRKSAAWCDAAILAIRNAGEPNPWKTATEEEIAGEILRKISERKGQ